MPKGKGIAFIVHLYVNVLCNFFLRVFYAHSYLLFKYFYLTQIILWF